MNPCVKENTLKNMGNIERNVTESETWGFCDEQRLCSALMLADKALVKLHLKYKQPSVFPAILFKIPQTFSGLENTVFCTINQNVKKIFARPPCSYFII
jgi:hypothetical protein